MSISNSDIVKNGLVMHYDIKNPKSFVGAPVTNYAYDQNPRIDSSYSPYVVTTSGTWPANHFGSIQVFNLAGTDISNLTNSSVGNWTNTIHAIWTYDNVLKKPVVEMRNTDYQWKAKSWWSGYSMTSMGLAAGSQYTISWLQWVSDIACSANAGIYGPDGSGTNNFWDGLSSWTSTSLNTKPYTWQRVYATFTVNATRNMGATVGCYMYGHGVFGILKIADVQIESHSYPSGFCNASSRSVTQCLYDLTGKSTANVSLADYDSTGSLIYTGSGKLVSTNFAQPLQDFTISAWFKDTGSPQYARIVDKMYNTGTMLMRNGNITNSWGGGVLETSGPYGRFITLTDGQWHNLVSIRKGTTHTLYGDGITNTTSGTVTSTALDTSTLNIGGWSSSGQCFIGQIPIVKVYNRALSPDEVMQNFNALRSRYGI